MTLDPNAIQPEQGAEQVAVDAAQVADKDIYEQFADVAMGGEEPAPAEPQQAEPEPAVQPQPVIAAPEHWANEDKEAFNALDTAAKQLVLARDKRIESIATKKLEEVAAKQKELAAWEMLTKRVQHDPKFAAHVFGYDQQAQVQQQQAPQPPEDPIERIKWEARQEAMKEFQPKLEEVQRSMQLSQTKQAIEATRARVQSDPMFQQVQNAIMEHVTGLPESVGRAVYQQLDVDPSAYMDMYMKTRTRLAGGSQQSPAQAQPQQVEQPQQPKPVQRQTRTPVLEDGGAAPVQTDDGAKQRKALHAKIRNGNASSDELGKYLELSGVIDKMNI
jgi:hypothetical protein